MISAFSIFFLTSDPNDLALSLILPQTHQINLALQKSGIECPNDLFSRGKLTNFIKNFIKNKTSEIVEGND